MNVAIYQAFIALQLKHRFLGTMGGSVGWQLVTDLSGRPICLIFKCQSVEQERFFLLTAISSNIYR